MHDRWFKPVFGSRMAPANWKGGIVALALVLGLTGISVAVFGIGLGRKVDWPEFIGWFVGVLVLVGGYETIVHLSSRDRR